MHRVNKGRYLLTHCNSGLMFLALLSAKLEVQVVLTSKSGKKQRIEVSIFSLKAIQETTSQIWKLGTTAQVPGTSLMIKFVHNQSSLINAYNFQSVSFYMVELNFCTSLKAFPLLSRFFYPPL